MPMKSFVITLLSVMLIYTGYSQVVLDESFESGNTNEQPPVDGF